MRNPYMITLRKFMTSPLPRVVMEQGCPLPFFSWLTTKGEYYSEPWENIPSPESVQFTLFLGSILNLKYSISCFINTYLPPREGLDYTSKWQQRDGLQMKMFSFLRLVFRCFIAIVEIGIPFNIVRMQKKHNFSFTLECRMTFIYAFIQWVSSRCQWCA